MCSDIAISVRNLSKCYQIFDTPRDRLKQFVYPCVQRFVRQEPKQYFREFWALKDISFEVKKGESFGIIGLNGSGKSTLLQIIAGTLAQNSGVVDVRGKVAALLELGSGFNPEFTGRENVYMNGIILGLSKKEIDKRFDEIAAFADIGDFIEQPVKMYSSGMFLRLAFAVQAHIDASIVIIDEALAVGDIFFRQKCYARLQQLKQAGAAILLVSHSMPDIEQYCERALLLDHGVSKYIGSSSEAAKNYYLLHQAGKPAANGPRLENRLAQTTAQFDKSINYPPPEAFIDLKNKSQVNNGQAYCTGIALCNIHGEPCNSFHQGDCAVFYYGFEIVEDIGVPICGIVISNDRHVHVYGKCNWQYDDDAPPNLGPGIKLFCRQEVTLNLGPGEYSFEVGLASVSHADWINREYISHEEFEARHMRVCIVTNVASFSIGMAIKNGTSFLTHHGVADLPGNIKISTDAH